MQIAIIHTGGKQYTVSSGDVIRVEKIVGDYKEGPSGGCFYLHSSYNLLDFSQKGTT